MGYHLTILRSAHGKQDPISLDEAKRAALKLGWAYEDTSATFSLSTEEGTMTVWHQDDELWTRNPEDWGIAPMITLAHALNARVRGDEFETHAADGTTFFHPDDGPLRQQAERESTALIAKSLREDHQRIRNVIVGFFVIVAALGYLIGKLVERS